MFKTLAVVLSVFASTHAMVMSSKRNMMKMAIDLPSFNPKTFAGITEPIGFFDPLDFTKDISESTFKKYRESEI